jgi:hypothetical protein
MNQDEQQMEKLARLIALKRFEQPAPGYFHLLPGRIISRIEKGEAQPGFWEIWLSAFTMRPALVYASAVAVCAAVTVGIFYSPTSETMASATGPMPSSLWAVSEPGEAADAQAETPGGLHVAGWLGSTAPVSTSETASMFENEGERPLPVSFLEGK